MRLCFYPCLSVCLSVCLYTGLLKSYERVLMKFLEGVWAWPKRQWGTFWWRSRLAGSRCGRGNFLKDFVYYYAAYRQPRIKRDILGGSLSSLGALWLLLGFTIYLWWRLLFLPVLLFFLSLFLSSQTKFSGQTRNLYRYGPQVDLRTLTQFQWPWPTFQGHRPIFVPKTRNFKSI